jgi:hypothetical protein
MKKLIRISVTSALMIMTQAALAANAAGQQPTQPHPPPILKPYPGPIGPNGPVDPTPVEPPTS